MSIGLLPLLARRPVSTKKKMKLFVSPGVSTVNVKTATEREKQLRDRLRMRAGDRIDLQDVHRASPPDCSTREADPLRQTVALDPGSPPVVYAVVVLCPAA